MSFADLKQYRAVIKKKWDFTNFQWTLPGAVARSSQPYYVGEDKPHQLPQLHIGVLLGEGIRCVISANREEMDQKSVKAMQRAGIAFHHFPVHDFTPPTIDQLVAAAEAIDNTNRAGGAALVYCGFGKGRTGTFIAAWALLKYLPKQGNQPLRPLCKHHILKPFFGVEKETQSQVVEAAVTGDPTYAVPAANLPAIGKKVSGIALPPGSGAPAIANFGGSAQSFASGPSFVAPQRPRGSGDSLASRDTFLSF